MKRNIEFIESGATSIEKYTFAIILAKYKGLWVFVRHRDRLTWELPAGHVEPGETVDEAASRELQEETGAREFSLSPLISYRGWLDGNEVFGKLFSAEITLLGDLPESEIEEVKCYADVPDDLTYPDIQPVFIAWFKNGLKI